jgi:hypothetical protein
MLFFMDTFILKHSFEKTLNTHLILDVLLGCAILVEKGLLLLLLHI